MAPTIHKQTAHKPAIHKDTPLHDIKTMGPACRCEKCSHGCTMGSGFLIMEDHAKLASYLNVSEEELKDQYLEAQEKFNTKLWKPKTAKNNHGYGPCIFYDNGCKVHDAKPTHCKVAMSCKDYGEDISIWFHANHFLDLDDPESIRQFATYLASGGKTISKARLEDLAPDALLDGILSYKILTRTDLEKARELMKEKEPDEEKSK